VATFGLREHRWFGIFLMIDLLDRALAEHGVGGRPMRFAGFATGSGF